jgi:5'-deoxynucleotidase YfbR-like HD superfamily hydrolase
MKVYFLDIGLVEAEDLVTGKIILPLRALAKGLESQKRFAGQTEGESFDVLRHSIGTAHLAAVIAWKLLKGELKPGGDSGLFDWRINFMVSECEAWGYFHDASEAVMADIASPVKRTQPFTGYRKAEAVLSEAYQRAYVPTLWGESHIKELSPSPWRRTFVEYVVHQADSVRLALEAIKLLPPDASNNVMDSLLPQTKELLLAELARGVDPLGWTLEHMTPVQYFCDRVKKLQRALGQSFASRVKAGV